MIGRWCTPNTYTICPRFIAELWPFVTYKTQAICLLSTLSLNKKGHMETAPHHGQEMAILGMELVTSGFRVKCSTNCATRQFVHPKLEVGTSWQIFWNFVGLYTFNNGRVKKLNFEQMGCLLGVTIVVDSSTLHVEECRNIALALVS